MRDHQIDTEVQTKAQRRQEISAKEFSLLIHKLATWKDLKQSGRGYHWVDEWGGGLIWTPLQRELEVEAAAEEGGWLYLGRNPGRSSRRDESAGYSRRCDTWRLSGPNRPCSRHV